MGISTDQSGTGDRTHPSRVAWMAKCVAVAVIASTLAAFPADAKKRRIVRSSYNPPQSAMVVDAYSGKILYAENADQERFPASVTKVMTLYIVFEQIRAGRMSLDTELKISADAASRPPSNLGLEAGETISLHDAMYALVTKSANDVAAVIAENIAGSEPAFARLMTQKAEQIGMTDTVFRNASGLPNPEQHTTARDLITLGRRVLLDFPQDAKIFSTRVFQYGNAKYKNHNGLLFSYPGTEGMKTGFTRDSGFNLLTSCRRDDKHLIAVVLGGRSSAHRNARMRTLLNQSWSKAVAFNDVKQRGKDRPVEIKVAAAATNVSPAEDDDDDNIMPERNPAFHASVSERTLSIAIAAAREAVAKPELEEPSPPTQLALAGAMAGPTNEAADEDAQPISEDEAEDEGDTSAEATPPVVAISPPATDDAAALGPYHVQVGSYLDPGAAKGRLAVVADKAGRLVGGHRELTVSGEVKGKAYYRARFGQFSQDDAAKTCAKLKSLSIECLVVRAE
ncbi:MULTISPECIES: D-alanyl-D-alanine carboxypeptidase [Rhodomicrobium]|uniref:D-alanyl-D-alanine carboxypeptidase n=1 Tax=Rhodomicrobium TaxID=1068 RepID=UPI000B4B27E0|nr:MULTISPECIES: D-alanyl-D-alanine carboxypeptidase [Rhodomicrobium]